MSRHEPSCLKLKWSLSAMNRPRSITRREMFRRSAAGGAAMLLPAFVPAGALGLAGEAAASEKIGVGIIALGRQCLARNLPVFLRSPLCRVTALCDPDRWRLALSRKNRHIYRGAAEELAKLDGCPRTVDFREVLDRGDVDAVMISSPDHWHVPMAVLAARAGKHICCEKPLSLTIADGRRLVAEVEKAGVVFRTDSEFRSNPHFHRACLLVLDGRIGRLESIRMAVPNWNEALPQQPEMPVPEELAYDLWQGPAPKRPYTERRVHPRKSFDRPGWYANEDYCNGALVNWGHHMADLAQWANRTERSGPVEAQGKAEFPPADGLWNVPLAFEVEYRYANGVRLSYHSVSNGPKERPYIRFAGTGGWIHVQYAPDKVTASTPELAAATPDEDAEHWVPVKNEKHDFIDCVKSGERTMEDAEVGHRATSLCQIGLIAARVGETLRWDPGRERFVDNEAANKLLGPYPARQAWDVAVAEG
jgi:myo-inositol 2-dehydrogenase / D-chiro-inositol 1-dehydrogenase